MIHLLGIIFFCITCGIIGSFVFTIIAFSIEYNIKAWKKFQTTKYYPIFVDKRNTIWYYVKNMVIIYFRKYVKPFIITCIKKLYSMIKKGFDKIKKHNVESKIFYKFFDKYGV